MSSAAERPALRDPVLLLLLAASLALNAWGIDWGLPSPHGWALDEVLPASVLDGMRRRFSDGWHEKYPPLHYYVLAAAYAPVLAAQGLGAGRPVPAGAYNQLFLIGRAVSLLMGAATVLFVYLCGRELFDRRASLLSASLVALMVPFVFYAKLANLDVPYVFWWMVSLLFLLRCLKRHHRRDYLLFAMTAVLAVCTKDQAYGLYVLTVPLLLVARWRGHRGGFGRDVLLTAGLAALLFLALHNVVWNADGFRAHFALITGQASRDFQEFTSDWRGHLALLARTASDVGFTLGAPALVACLAGLVAAGREPRLLALLVPGLSYYLFFVAVVRYSYDRFTIPLGILLAFFGGRFLAQARGIARAAVAALFVYGLARALSVGLLMTNDSRYVAEAWLRQHAGTESLVGAVGPPEHLPRLDGLRWRTVGPRAERLEKIRPDYLVINADYGRRATEGTGEREFYTRLQEEQLGYRLAYEYRFASPLVLLDTEGLRDVSNIGKVNPLLRIYRKAEESLESNGS